MLHAGQSVLRNVIRSNDWFPTVTVLAMTSKERETNREKQRHIETEQIYHPVHKRYNQFKKHARIFPRMYQKFHWIRWILGPFWKYEFGKFKGRVSCGFLVKLSFALNDIKLDRLRGYQCYCSIFTLLFLFTSSVTLVAMQRLMTTKIIQFYVNANGFKSNPFNCKNFRHWIREKHSGKLQPQFSPCCVVTELDSKISSPWFEELALILVCR